MLFHFTYLILFGMVLVVVVVMDAVLKLECHKKLLMPYSNDFEVRICKYGPDSDEDIAIEKLEIFVM